MALLILFGFVAGAATALSPCVLPVLPIALSAGATGGRRRPLGVVAGLALSFTFATVALVYVIAALGLPGDLLRKLAIAVLLAFGLTLMAPPLAARLEGWISRFSARSGTPGARGDGFWSGVLVGLSLGLVYAPCAGPILAGVITVSASQSFDAGRLAVALSYGIGSAVVLYFLMLGGRRAIAPLARRGAAFQVAMGAVMVVVALAMLGNYDVRFQNAIASDLPAFLVNPSQGLEETASAKTALADLRGSNHGIGSELDTGAPQTMPNGRLKLPVLGRAPEFVGTERWFNTPGDQPLTLRQLRGRVVLVDFWTYSCINCLRTLPYLKAWDARYRKDGLTIVGIHSPEFPFEREAGNVEEAIESNDIHYPVAQDNELRTWEAYANQFWPAEYFIDARGSIRYVHFGEGEYGEKEKVIRQLLAEAGDQVGQKMSGAHGIEPSAGVTTPETYLGDFRAERFTNPELSPGLHDFHAPPHVPPNEFSFRGPWRIEFHSATAAGGSLELNFGARHVYLVLGTADDRPRRVKVFLDGEPIGASAGADVHGGVVTVRAQRLYDLVDLSRVGHHVLRLEPEAGVTGYAFTFG
ncbi:MAG TPA: cytochrome c biogenesis protein DipZ [Solirubrobacterales bacterium]|nr:cytochrome c biogenesis protein DipZ [Solirubrobacterales bacterium]